MATTQRTAATTYPELPGTPFRMRLQDGRAVVSGDVYIKIPLDWIVNVSKRFPKTIAYIDNRKPESWGDMVLEIQNGIVRVLDCKVGWFHTTKGNDPYPMHHCMVWLP